MICLRKTGHDEAILQLDPDGARRFLAALRSLQGGQPDTELSASIDATLLGRRGREIHVYPTRLAKQVENIADSSLSFEDSHVLWRFVEREEEIVYTIKRLEDAIAQGFFYPAEFMAVQTPKSRHLTQIFAEMVPESHETTR